MSNREITMADIEAIERVVIGLNAEAVILEEYARIIARIDRFWRPIAQLSDVPVFMLTIGAYATGQRIVEHRHGQWAMR